MVTFPTHSLPYAIASLRVELAWELGGYGGKDVNLVIQKYELATTDGMPFRSFIITVPSYLCPADYLDGVLKVLAMEGDCDEFDWTVLGL